MQELLSSSVYSVHCSFPSLDKDTVEGPGCQCVWVHIVQVGERGCDTGQIEKRRQQRLSSGDRGAVAPSLHRSPSPRQPDCHCSRDGGDAWHRCKEGSAGPLVLYPCLRCFVE